MNFNKGDTVRLKSGGPTMTIDNIQTIKGNAVIVCTWFDKDNKYFSQVFSPESLESFKPAASSVGIF
ncbi:YodC family protein [Citrobacter koseri]|uniref:YodC family protein n=1 Tax=Citrobacter koseri TaxID=545 RepID=UPI000D7297CF|nr:DUF2158 domain-containing protein [Citrobacter koseri]EDZ3666756.1 DUF2158 domain-containing protein [Salmonella enterica]PWY09537.1 DUF2158 domain-containing protein [Citrobacter koseri]